MNYEPTSQQLTPNVAKKATVEDLFLPSVIDAVRHIARMAAERDYKTFLATGKISYANPHEEDCDD